MPRPNRWGLRPGEVKGWVYGAVQEYPGPVTLRGVHYRLVVRHGFPNVLGAYKWLSRWVKRWRLEDPWLNERFVDLGRLPVLPRPPGLRKVEVWLEKHSTYVLLRDILERFGVPVQVQRGYGSLSMFSRALRRAGRRGVRTIAYFGDLDPSGLDIERVTRERMGPVRVVRLALTWGQVRELGLPPRPANPRDRRTPRYVGRYGNRTYEIEALDPRALRRMAEEGLRRLIPPGELRELRLRERAARIARELLEPLRQRVERMVRRLLERGVPPEEIRRRLGRALG